MQLTGGLLAEVGLIFNVNQLDHANRQIEKMFGHFYLMRIASLLSPGRRVIPAHPTTHRANVVQDSILGRFVETKLGQEPLTILYYLPVTRRHENLAGSLDRTGILHACSSLPGMYYDSPGGRLCDAPL